MFLYLLERKDHIDYDQNDAFVVAAKDPKQARLFVSQSIGSSYEPPESWTDSSRSSCTKIGTTDFKKKRIILKSFNAG